MVEPACVRASYTKPDSFGCMRRNVGKIEFETNQARARHALVDQSTNHVDKYRAQLNGKPKSVFSLP
jgi:hypothetical protein